MTEPISSNAMPYQIANDSYTSSMNTLQSLTDQNSQSLESLRLDDRCSQNPLQQMMMMFMQTLMQVFQKFLQGQSNDDNSKLMSGLDGATIQNAAATRAKDDKSDNNGIFKTILSAVGSYFSGGTSGSGSWMSSIGNFVGNLFKK